MDIITSSMWSEFPTEIFALSLTVLVYVLRIMNKRAVTVEDFLRFEMKMGRLVRREIDALRAEFDAKLDR